MDQKAEKQMMFVPRMSLRTKLLLIIIGLMLFCGMAFIGLLQTEFREKLTLETKKIGLALAKHTSFRVADSLLIGDFRTIHLNINEILEENREDIEYIFILDRNRNVIAHTFGESFPGDIKDVNRLKDGKSQSIRTLTAETKTIIDLAVPTLHFLLGEVHVGMKNEVVTEGVAEMTTRFVIIITLTLLIATGVACLFSLRVTKPLAVLNYATHSIRDGHFDHQLDIRTGDEIEEVATSFNVMCEALREREESLHEQAAMLEEEVAERQKSEEEVHRLNIELEQRVILRTSELEAANMELEAFSYSVSHDLRAPLRHIDGYVDLLVSRCRDDLSDKGLHYVDIIAASARQMGTLIDDLLQFSRTGRAEMHKEKVDMNQLLKETMTKFQEGLSDRAIEWVVADLPAVLGDYSLLRQVWSNLLENAVKYTSIRETARIEVRATEVNGEIVFTVQDNGVGFDMQYVNKLFGVFQRLHSQEDFEGTGIGLATVQRIINRHGGRVWAEAEVDKGATFYFALPA